MRVIRQFIGIKRSKTPYATKKHFAILSLEKRVAFELVSLQAIRQPKVSESVVFRIKITQSVIGTQPEMPFFVFQNAVNDIAGKALLFRKRCKLILDRVKMIQSATQRPNP